MRIKTSKIKATDTRGERVKAAMSGGGSITLGWDYSSNTEDVHREAAEQLAGGPVKLVGSHARGYVFEVEKWVQS